MIDLRNLPEEIKTKIPLSIRSFKNKYKLNELPPTIQLLVKPYIDSSPDFFQENRILDFIPELGYSGDLKPIVNISTLVVEYIKNYILTDVGSYPFDVTFGSNIRKNIQKMDSTVRDRIVRNDVQQIVDEVTRDLDVDVKIKDIKFSTKTIDNMGIEYNFILELEIEGIIKKVTMIFS